MVTQLGVELTISRSPVRQPTIMPASHHTFRKSVFLKCI